MVGLGKANMRRIRLIARGGQKTNRIMTVLTLTSVILLPSALLAAVMGMNFKVGLFRTRPSSG
jgi:Mg2+ and Co2+ transporter CorA